MRALSRPVLLAGLGLLAVSSAVGFILQLQWQGPRVDPRASSARHSGFDPSWAAEFLGVLGTTDRGKGDLGATGSIRSDKPFAAVRRRLSETLGFPAPELNRGSDPDRASSDVREPRLTLASALDVTGPTASLEHPLTRGEFETAPGPDRTEQSETARPAAGPAAAQRGGARRSAGAPSTRGEEPGELESTAETGAGIDPALPAELSPLQRYARPTDALDPDRVMVSTAKVTHVYAEPSASSRKIGYLRAGAVVRRGAEPVGYEGCADGFYEVVPQGYVCVGRTASIDAEHPIARAVSRRPDRQAVLPYRYGISPMAGAPLYTRIPTEEEQRETEKDLHWHLEHSSPNRFDDYRFDEVPWFLREGAPSFSLHGYRFSKKHVYLRYAIPNSGFSFISFFESNGRKFGLTVDMTLVPLDRLRPVEPSAFHGLPLSEEVPLPVVFVRSKHAALYRGDPESEGLEFDRRLEYREAIPITGRRERVGNRTYLETRDGDWIRDRRLVRIDPMEVVPSWAQPGRSWIDVSILDQTLVAYEGTTPVFATLVSTGKDGIKDHEEHHATIQGKFLIHTKHVSVTMSSDEVGDEFDLRDVPYVQYFTQGYALHAAYWHDAYGLPKSHGCINLSPLDARWLFGWTDPPVPHGWHGAMSLHDGTLVYVHP